MSLPPGLLVTGGAGFIGSTLIRQAVAEGRWKVTNLDKLTYAGSRASLEEISDNQLHELIEGDVADAVLVREILAEHSPAAVIHLAAESHVDRSIDAPPVFATTNVVGTCVLLDEVTRYWQTLSETQQRAFHFLFVSTDEVFGSAEPEEFFDERSRLAPNSPYAASKAAGEHFVRAFARTYGLPAVVANPTNNYGPRQHPEKLIPTMILAAAEGGPLPVYGDGQQQRDWMHVEDCSRALLKIVEQKLPGPRYVIGSNHCVSNLQVVEAICDFVDRVFDDGGNRRELIQHVADRPGHDERYAVRANLFLAQSQWRPQVEFRKGLENTVRWYLENRDWARQMQAR